MKKLVYLLLLCLALSPLLLAIPKTKAIELTIDRTFSTSSSDGYIEQLGVTYAESHNDTEGYIFSNTLTMRIGQRLTSCGVSRTFLPFDTSTLPDGANITEVILSIYISTNYSDTDFNVTIQNGQPTYPHIPLETTDYYYAYYSGDGGSRNTTEISSLGYWNITLNSDGMSWISKTTTTKLALLSSRDIAYIEPSGDEYITINSAERGEAYSPKLYVTYELEGYTYILHGAYNEQGTRDGAINCTFYRETEEPYSVELDGEENVTSETLPVAFHFDLGNNESRVYYLMSDFEEIYVIKPSDPYYTYYVTVYDFVGVSNGYLETLININGTDRVVERWRLEMLTDIPFTLTWGVAYKFRLICNQGTYTYGSVVAGADMEIEISVTSQHFPTDYTSFGQNVSVSATRVNATYIQVLYNDNSNYTVWVNVTIRTKYGAIAYSTNDTSQTQTIDWYDAINTTDYYCYMTISHETLGTLYYSRVLASPIRGTSPWDLDFLGDWPIPPTQIFGFGIVLIFGCLASTKNVGVGLFITAIIAALLYALGWLDVNVTALTVAVVFSIMLGIVVVRRRE